MSEATAEPTERAAQTGGMRVFLYTLCGLIALRTLLGFITFPGDITVAANIVVGSIFLGAPIVALFFAGREEWTRVKALTFILGGLSLQFGMVVLVNGVPSLSHSALINLLVALSQAGLPIWAVGLGALIATLLKDKNMILPIALTLAILDLFLVFTPIGTANQVMRKAPKFFTSVALNVPKVKSGQEPPRLGPKLVVTGYAGPADFVFLSMFFVALFRHRMRTHATLVALVPTLLFYLVLSGIFEAPLPALVPIGIVILIVNRREFDLTRDERMATATVGVLGIALLIYGMTRQGEPVAPLPREFGQGSPRSRRSISPVVPSPRPSNALPAPESTPSPR